MLRDDLNSKIQAAKILAGCQTWFYRFWKTKRGGPTVFFPLGIRPEEYLAFYSKIFDTVEINTSFYAAPKIADLKSWYDQTPGKFIFSLKMPRDVTHAHSLKSAAFPIAEEFLSRVSVLKHKLGVVLVQLPASFKMTRATQKDLREFIDFLPRKMRFAVEFRSPEWFNPEVFGLLEKRKIALCLGTNEFIPLEKMIEALAAPSADFAYLRFGGPRDLTEFDRIQRPRENVLNFWAGQVKQMQSLGTESFIYFSNHFEGHSPASAMNFRKMLGQKFTSPAEYESAPGLF